MKRQVKIFISKQANLILNQMPNVKVDDVIDWFCNERKISIGGGDIIDYLKYKVDE